MKKKERVWRSYGIRVFIDFSSSNVLVFAYLSWSASFQIQFIWVLYGDIFIVGVISSILYSFIHSFILVSILFNSLNDQT